MEAEAATKAIQLLEQLTDKLGTKASEAWPHYVNFIYAQAWSNLIGMMLVGIMGAIVMYFGYLMARNKWIDPDNITPGGIATVCTFICGAILLFAFIITGEQVFPTAIPTLIDPEGAALRSLLFHK